jgi:hypothetical protein
MSRNPFRIITIPGIGKSAGPVEKGENFKMSAITVVFKNGKTEHFPETSRAGGSYCTSIRFKEGFAIIENAYGTETIFPGADIERIKVDNQRCF